MARAFLTLSILALGASTGLAIAQGPAGDDRLGEVQREAEAAERRAVQLESQATQALDEAARARAAKAAVATRVVAAEAEISSAETEVKRVAALRSGQRARLAAQQQPIIRLTAALQTMAQRPPVLALVQPGSLDDLVHVRALLATQLPAIHERTADLRREVDQGVRLQRQADAAAANLRDGRNRLRQERAALATLEIQQQVRAQALTDASMNQSDRALALGEEARSLNDLMSRVDNRASVGERLAALPGPVLRPLVPGQASLPPEDEANRAATQLAYRLPVNGKLVQGLGEISEAGVRARGLTIGAETDALVVAPAQGRVAYAGPFRGYDNIVIVEHGGGWTSLVTGMTTLSANVGEAVDQGSPLGRAHGGPAGVTIELRRNGEPVDIVPLLGRT
ncbi:Septal ring factor EnvC, activator of murein hydrolases AmiA and AmiB [Sphingomonas laterariae]|uniref:Septal ring factor EnvC, activator of murein hydrolases AmiA and AmiB n=1 Tax=Edaphosphingomonas laterariae TaxID=861865 RepID=A0A239EXK1_9SPHN|nr:peptidoglycan DD-metalloendopeptidase family protein [Sphingomonas laterariae]SNS49317.1 Septal ring factor EnvC, activator of murein hydrolases AmiA and AmiB [Sphingomonas laterariae]